MSTAEKVLKLQRIVRNYVEDDDTLKNLDYPKLVQDLEDFSKSGEDSKVSYLLEEMVTDRVP